jgi:hypothetical protein
MTFEEWYESVGVILPSWRDKASLARAWNAGAESRDAEVAELCLQLNACRQLKQAYIEELADMQKREVMLRDVMHMVSLGHKDSTTSVPEKYREAVKLIREALAATDPGSTNQDKSAIFRSLGLVPWDNKPPACTDTVWIEPGKNRQ